MDCFPKSVNLIEIFLDGDWSMYLTRFKNRSKTGCQGMSGLCSSMGGMSKTVFYEKGIVWQCSYAIKRFWSIDAELPFVCCFYILGSKIE